MVYDSLVVVAKFCSCVWSNCFAVVETTFSAELHVDYWKCKYDNICVTVNECQGEQVGAWLCLYYTGERMILMCWFFAFAGHVRLSFALKSLTGTTDLLLLLCSFVNCCTEKEQELSTHPEFAFSFAQFSVHNDKIKIGFVVVFQALSLSLL